jgi:hypothetical protein
MYRQFNVGEGDLVAEPEVPPVAEVADGETDAQLGDAGAEVTGRLVVSGLFASS